MKLAYALWIADWATYLPLAFILIHGRPFWQQFALLSLLVARDIVLSAREVERNALVHPPEAR
jgi:hypothetical protein